MKTALYMGSFNPPHKGHYNLANTVLEKGIVDKVLFIVSPHNPHKEYINMVDENNRFEMVKQMIISNGNMDVSDIEFNLPKPSYTYNTLNKLNISGDVYYIIGSDSFNTLDKWYMFEYLLEKVTFIVFERDGEIVNDKIVKMCLHKPIILKSYINTSSTYIRNCIKNNVDISELVDNNVLNYINDKKLYI